ncbi:MAG: ComF family protein [Schleiferiaceae bacterium]|nr:ComF family protein [Schleiferiaceae bacterium]
MKTVAKDILELFFPHICHGCGVPLLQNEKHLCLTCHYELPLVNEASSLESSLHRILYGRMPLLEGAAFLYFQKGSFVQEILHAFKYEGAQGLCEHMGQLMGMQFNKNGFFNQADYLIPVPLHPKKERKRGYNQAAILAKGMSNATKIPLNTSLIARNQFTESQTKKSRFARWLNVSSVFEVPPEASAQLRDKHIVLIDDVITTGATLEACAKPLIDLGAKISVATLAKAQ